MRMWMIPAPYLCRQHLLGEHKELHMLAGALIRGRSLDGHLERHQLWPKELEGRHAELVVEMKFRGYRHRSPLPTEADGLPAPEDRPSPALSPDARYAANLLDLQNRCAACRARFHDGEEEDQP